MASGNPQRRTTSLALSIAIASLCTATLVWTEIHLYSRNTLALNGRWISTKAELELGVAGSTQFLNTRHALSRNRLDLSAWHAFNELTFNQVLAVREIRARFLLARGAYVIVTFNRSPSGFAGVRISRRSSYESTFFRADPAQKFLEKEPFRLPQLGSGWHELHLVFADDGLDVRIDGDLVAEIDESALDEQVVGFRSGEGGVLVDDVEIVTKEGRSIEESFRNTRGRGRSIVFHGAFSTVAGLLVFGVVQLGGARRSRLRGLFACATLGLTLSVVGSIYLAFDFFRWSGLHYRAVDVGPAARIARSLEAWRAAYFAGLARVMGDDSGEAPAPIPFLERSLFASERAARAPSFEYTLFDASGHRFIPFLGASIPEPAPGALRIVLVGSSQTWGSGAAALRDTLGARIQAIAQRRASVPIEVLVFARNGARSADLVEAYRVLLPRLAPTIAVVNLSYNDKDDVEKLGESLRDFVELNADRGILMALVEEAASSEGGRAIAASHRMVREVGVRMDVPVLDLHRFMNDARLYDSGFIWWDEVHMSSYGQWRAGRWLARRITLLLERSGRLPGDEASGQPDRSDL